MRLASLSEPALSKKNEIATLALKQGLMLTVQAKRTDLLRTPDLSDSGCQCWYMRIRLSLAITEHKQW